MGPEHVDPFTPSLRAPFTPYVLTDEQERLVIEVLGLTSSDSRFAQKALIAIRLILSGGSILITSLEPTSGLTGTVNVKVKCKGSGFDSTCIIYINGVAQTTTFTSPIEVSCDVNLVGVPVGTIRQFTVRNSKGEVSNSMPFTVT
jgi:hypothetical protein